MNGELLFAALGEAAPEDILRSGRAGGYFGGETGKRRMRPTARIVLIAAAITLLLAGAVGAKVVLGVWNDRWVQEPARDPAAVVRTAIENQTQKEYTVSVQVGSVREDEEEADKVWAGSKDSMLARLNGWTDTHAALAPYDRADFKAFYAEYTAEYDHTKTFYPDGRLGQWFYLIRGQEGNWEIWDSCDPISLDTAQEETEPSPETEQADTDGAVDEAIRMVQAWEKFEDVGAVTVEKAECSPERKAHAMELLSGSTLAEAEGWTEAYLKENLAAVEITWTAHPAPDPALPDAQPVTETAVYYLLRDPATGQWSNSEITGFMDGKE